MKLVVNGEEIEVAEGMTIEALVASRGLSADKVAVEVNRRLVRSSGGGYGRELKAGDVVEIVTFVGGG